MSRKTIAVLLVAVLATTSCAMNMSALDSPFDSGAAASEGVATSYRIEALKIEAASGTSRRGMAVLIARSVNQCRFLTAAHIVEGADWIGLTPSFADATETARYKGRVTRRDAENDAAQIEAECTDQPRPARLSSLNARIGSSVFLIGQPVDGYAAMRRGIVSGYWPKSDTFSGLPLMVSDAIVTLGFSGGGAYSPDGDLVGVILGRNEAEEGYTYILGAERLSKFLASPGLDDAHEQPPSAAEGNPKTQPSH